VVRTTEVVRLPARSGNALNAPDVIIEWDGVADPWPHWLAFRFGLRGYNGESLCSWGVPALLFTKPWRIPSVNVAPSLDLFDGAPYVLTLRAVGTLTDLADADERHV
jgi:hypothetical protein